MFARGYAERRISRGSTAEPMSNRWKTLTPYLFIAPFYLLFIAFGLLPLLGSFGMSLFAWRGANPGSFVVFGNYVALTKDPGTTTARAFFGNKANKIAGVRRIPRRVNRSRRICRPRLMRRDMEPLGQPSSRAACWLVFPWI